MALFVLLVILLVWNLEKLTSRYDRKWQNSSSYKNRKSRRASQFSSGEFPYPLTYADAEAQLAATSTQTPVDSEDTASSESGVETEPAVEDDNMPDMEENESRVEAERFAAPVSLREADQLAALEASRKRLVAADLYTSELKARVAESQSQVTLLEEKLALAETGLVKSAGSHQLDADHPDDSHQRVDELEMELAHTKNELETALASANESALSLQETTERLRHLEDVEQKIVEENTELKSKWEELAAQSNQAADDAELKIQQLLENHESATTDHAQAKQDLDQANQTIAELQSRIDAEEAELNQQLTDKLETATTRHAQAKQDLDQANQSIVELQSRIDSQQSAIEEARLEKSEHLQAAADHEAVLEQLRLTHDETINARQSEFETTSSELRSQATELQSALDVANDELKQLRDEATEAVIAFEAFEAKENLSLKCLDELEQRLVDSTISIEKERSLRLDLEQSVERLEHELTTRANEATQLQADLLKAEEAISDSNATQEQREVELQGEVERLEQELTNRANEATQLQADLLKAEEAISDSNATKEQRKVQLQGEVERLEQELTNRANEATQLQADLLKAEEAISDSNATKEQREVELQSEVKRLEQELTTRTDEAYELEADLLKAEEAVSAINSSKEQREVELQGEVERLEQELTTGVTAASQLQAGLLKAEELVSAKEQREVELKEEAGRLQQELATQTAAATRLEAELLKSEQTLGAAQLNVGQRETELQSQVKNLEEELSTQVTACSKLEANLLEAQNAIGINQASEEKRTSELQANVERLEREIGSLQSILDDQKTLGAEVVEKMVKYKTRYRKNKLHLEELTEKNSSMKALATEYFEAAKASKNDLEHQIKLVESLKQKLQTQQQLQNTAENSSTQESTNGLSQSEINRMVEQRARKYVLDLKAHFEMRIKRKNDLIRKLRDSAGIPSGSNGTKKNGVRAPKGQANGHPNSTKQDRMPTQTPQ